MVVVVWPWSATKGPYCGSIAPPPMVVGRRMERKKGKISWVRIQAV